MYVLKGQANSVVPAPLKIEGEPNPIDVRLGENTYEMREMVFGKNMAITFERDGSELEFSANADGPDAVFIAGQSTDNPHCSFGLVTCQNIGTQSAASSPLHPNMELCRLLSASPMTLETGRVATGATKTSGSLMRGALGE